MAKEIRIIGLNVTNRIKEAGEVQKLLTEYGCYIKTRLGLHEVTEDFCSQCGLIILELFGDIEKQKELEKKLRAIEYLEVEKMIFNN